MAKESKHVIKFKERHAQPGENVLAWADGYIGEMMGTGKKTQHNGSLIVLLQQQTGHDARFFIL